MSKRGTDCLGVHYTGYGNRMCTGYGISCREEQKISVWGILGTEKQGCWKSNNMLKFQDFVEIIL